LPAVYDKTVRVPEDVGKIAPEAGYLLTAAFPYLTSAQAGSILTATEGPGGGFLDDRSAFGVYSRIDRYRAQAREQSLWLLGAMDAFGECLQPFGGYALTPR
jgi:hypothetical protein